VSTPLAGKRGRAIRVSTDWQGWAGDVAHPDAPAGGGGPGGFVRAIAGDPELGSLPDPWQPGPAQAIPLQGSQTPSPPNAPPATKPRSLGTLKSLQNDLYDVEVDAVIAADATGGTGDAETTFTGGQAWTAPSYSSTGNKIVSFDKKFVWKGTVTIQSNYAQGMSAKDVSCYGRGTTAADVQNRDITLGFHESCHRDDYEAFLKANALPDPPTLKVGMTENAFNTAINEFRTKVTNYFNRMKADSEAKTDEVGFTRSKALKTGKCYVHLVP
jgi:hypothetical protein